MVTGPETAPRSAQGGRVGPASLALGPRHPVGSGDVGSVLELLCLVFGLQLLRGHAAGNGVVGNFAGGEPHRA